MTTQGPITIYNKRLGPDRRDMYYPTMLSAASYSEAIGSTHGEKATDERLAFHVRVPVYAEATDGRTFIRPDAYAALGADQAPLYWTTRQLDLVTRGAPVVDGPATEREIRDAAAAAGIDVIIIEEHADNTGRGSMAVRHWRIEGR